MANKMTNHMAQELIKNRISTEGFKIFTGMGLEFDENQIDTLSRYLDTIVIRHTAKIEENNDIVITDDKVHDYTNVLLEIILDLILISFTNFGVAIYHKSK